MPSRRTVLVEFVFVQFHSQSGSLWDQQITLFVQHKRLGGDIFDISTRSQIFNVACYRHSGRELQISREADRGIPTMRDHLHVVIESQPGDLARFTEAPIFRAIWLNNVKRASFDPREKRLSTRENFSPRDGNWRAPRQFDVSFQVVRREGL